MSKKGVLVAVILLLLMVSSVVALFYSSPWLRPDLKTARNHPLQYYISLPDNWTADQKWPILVTIDGSNKDYLNNIKAFMRVRNNLPFIIVTPLVTSNGTNTDPSSYNYSDAVWQQIAQNGSAQFDYEGLLAVISDIQRDYNGQEKFFITGWSAGGHFTWQMIFNHPEKLAGAALAAANYAGRGITPISTEPVRATLPIKAFQGDVDTALNALNSQWETAQKTATESGYQNVSRDIIQGKGHSPFPNEVFTYFNSLYLATRN